MSAMERKAKRPQNDQNKHKKVKRNPQKDDNPPYESNVLDSASGVTPLQTDYSSSESHGSMLESNSPNKDVLISNKIQVLELENQYMRTFEKRKDFTDYHREIIKQEVLADMRHEFQQFQDHIEEHIDRKFNYLKFEMRQGMKDLKAETRALSGELKEFKNETSCELKQIIEQTTPPSESTVIAYVVEIMKRIPDYSMTRSFRTEYPEHTTATEEHQSNQATGGTAPLSVIAEKPNATPSNQLNLTNTRGTLAYTSTEDSSPDHSSGCFPLLRNGKCSKPNTGDQQDLVPTTHTTIYMNRGNFCDDRSYGRYVYKLLKKGMIVRMRCAQDGLEAGDFGLFVEKWWDWLSQKYKAEIKREGGWRYIVFCHNVKIVR